MYSYLALGDSYTIGEQVAGNENFPAQTVAILEKEFQIKLTAPRIIATTGWTTDELATAIHEHQIKEKFDIVTLLIGVNNQYRGRSVDNYRIEFAQLINRAILFAGGNTRQVFVVSIPDWGVTPFASGKDRAAIAKAIDEFNKCNRAITLAYRCHYIDITPLSRIQGQNEQYLTPDKLHYSATAYKEWANMIAPEIARQLNT